jgi:hypothetical protein
VIQHHPEIVQGSDAWLAVRAGRLTASEIRLIMSPTTLKPARNDTSSAHLYELLAQRITGHVEPRYVSDDMLRGQTDEIEARGLYSRHFAPVTELGFITRDCWGFTIGYSPDGLVGDDGLIECKSRRQKYQTETLITGAVPSEHVLQCQTGLLVSGRQWLDYVSYCAGMPMAVIRVWPDETVQAAIVEAASVFEEALADRLEAYRAALSAEGARLVATERRIEQEMIGL